MKLLLSTFGVGVASALIPIINIEAYIAAIAALVDSYGIWPVSVVAAVGQAVGKVCWYEAGRSSLHWRPIQKKMSSPGWQRQYDKVKRRTDDRPWMGMGLLFLSAVVGLPPLAIMAVLAGQLKFHRFWFFATTFVGRTLRFAAVLGGVSYLTDINFFH
ncbi:MAG: VTT domain-containing protein [Nocardioidaceae bacterium]|nr:VTT domain-containing protein [Nocardioidaceae bacterium]